MAMAAPPSPCSAPSTRNGARTKASVAPRGRWMAISSRRANTPRRTSRRRRRGGPQRRARRGRARQRGGAARGPPRGRAVAGELDLLDARHAADALDQRRRRCDQSSRAAPRQGAFERASPQSTEGSIVASTPSRRRARSPRLARRRPKASPPSTTWTPATLGRRTRTSAIWWARAGATVSSR